MSFQTNFYNTIFGGSSSSLSFYSMASEMRSINSGTYGRLLKKYYSTFGTQKASSSSSSTSNTSSTSDSTSTKKTSGYDVLAHVSGHDAVSDTKKTTDTDKTSDAKSTTDTTKTSDSVTKKTSDANTTANTSVSAEEMTKRLYTSSGNYAASGASSFNTAV